MFDRAGDVAREWERFGSQEPYFGVLAHERFQRDRLDDAALDEFFASGREQVDAMLAFARAQAPLSDRLGRVMDFGCGVGRLLVALAEHADVAVGVDVSPAMLDEAQRNCRARGAANASFVETAALETLQPGFDLIVSQIVFQHIPVSHGLTLLGRLADLLAPRGVAVLHFTLSPASKLTHVFYGVLRSLPPVRRLWNVIRGRRADFPFMEMNSYRLERLLAVLREHGIGEVAVRFDPASRWADHNHAVLGFARAAKAQARRP